jgi:hypothetical protein
MYSEDLDCIQSVCLATRHAVPNLGTEQEQAQHCTVPQCLAAEAGTMPHMLTISPSPALPLWLPLTGPCCAGGIAVGREAIASIQSRAGGWVEQRPTGG